MGDRIRIVSSSRWSCGSSNDVTIGGLSDEEAEFLKGMVSGHQWMTVEGDQLVFFPRDEGLPSLQEDDEMLPFWRSRSSEKESGVQEEFSYDEVPMFSSPSIFIQGLCPYSYTPEGYREEARKLQSWGFAHMRSKRGKDGKYWEVWYLSNLIMARGALGIVIKRVSRDSYDSKKEFDAAIEFLRRNCRLGSLDVTVQRFAVAPPD